MFFSISCQTFFPWKGAKKSRTSFTVSVAFLFKLRFVLGCRWSMSFRIWYLMGLILPSLIKCKAELISFNEFPSNSLSILHDEIWDDVAESCACIIKTDYKRTKQCRYILNSLSEISVSSQNPLEIYINNKQTHVQLLAIGWITTCTSHI